MGWLPVTFALGLAGLLFWGATFVAWRRREVPAADLFAVVSGLSGTGALVIAASIGLDFPHEITLLSTIAVGLSLPVPWLLFSLKYTGRGELLSFSATSAAAAPSGIGLVATSIIFGAQLGPWLRLPSQEAASGLVAIGVTLLVTLQWLALLYAGGLMLVGSAVLLATFHRYKHLDSSTGALLGIFGTVPWLSVLFGLQVDGVAPLALSRTAAVGFLAGGVAAVSVLGPYRLFHRVPAAGNVGPATVVEELDDPVVVTDGGGIVVEVNAAVEQTLGTGATDVVGADIEGLLGAPLTELEGTDTVEIRADAGRTLFEPAVSELTNHTAHPSAAACRGRARGRGRDSPGDI